MTHLSRAVLLLALGVLLPLACAKAGPATASTPRSEPTVVSTFTPVPSPTATATPAPAPTSQISPTATVTKARTQKGVSLSPKSFSSSDFTGFFQKAQEAGNLISWAGDWNELGNTAGGGPKVVAELSSTYGYTPLIVAQFFNQSSGRLLRPLDAATAEAYKSSAVAFAQRYKPKYLALGIEVNMLYEKSPADFDLFAQLFSQVYAEVKSVSPSTQVFTVFQLERMKGLAGGLFGGRNDASLAQWQLLDRFPDSDIIAFTTYPGLVFRDPEEVPPDYYAEIKSRTSKRIAFTEVGWHTAASPAGWESSEAEQGRFVSRFFKLTEGLEAGLVIWSFLYDQNTIEPFRSMGLLRSDGSARPAWDEWVRH